uniref:Uncharacterized protein n=1 Tax=Parastrongyloides trichosuri TaxID=131310 RepID=A0A0N4ZJW1_PARTI
MKIYLIFLFLVPFIISDPIRLLNQKWARMYSHNSYQRKIDPLNFSSEQDYQDEAMKENYGYSKQGMKDLDEVGTLTGGGDSSNLQVMRPYYTMADMTANGNKQGIGSYIHVLPDEDYGEKPIYTLGGSFHGGLEPAGVKMGHIARPFGK